MPKFKIALLCGGPSLERAISLNSARTVCDHLQSEKIEILPVYFDHKKNSYLISRAQLYSNTPADFDFKLGQTAKPLTRKKLVNFLKNTDLIFPVMHGQFGENGEVQKFLEKNNIPYIGSSSTACKLAFDKYISNKFIEKQGFYTLPSIVLLNNNRQYNKKIITSFFKKYKIKRAIVKPATSGSSIAVYSVANVKAAFKASQEIFSKKVDNRVVVEPFCQGREFTVIILENKNQQPVAILPTEIELSYKDHQIFDYRKKYLASRHVTYHCPPRFSDKTIFQIQKQAQELFKLFKMRDFARFDGWLLPNGKIWFSDFNPVSGMEQNSFLFMQTSRLGMSHRDLLRYVVNNACRRYGINFSQKNLTSSSRKNKKINVIFGGDTAERQVSVMSGTNVWLKLKNSSNYDPRPFLLDIDRNVWRLPYTLTLNHTVEEIAETCVNAKRDERRMKRLVALAKNSLKLKNNYLSENWFLPKKMSLNNFIKKSLYVFIGLHGGFGENGELQKILEKYKKPFNGSPRSTSKLCMDKFATAQKIKALEKFGIFSSPQTVFEFSFLKKTLKNKKNIVKLWDSLRKKLNSKTIIVKPLDDGCSSGIARLYNSGDLKTYLNYAIKRAISIPQDKLTNQHGIIEMPACPMRKIMFEKFIETDKVRIFGKKLLWEKRTGWIEVTIGIIEEKGRLHALNPSLTVAGGNVLTLEEKFQGGTGINITPPPAPFVSAKAIETAKIRTEKVAKLLGLKNYARIDAFMNTKNGELIIIEANTLPGLTPSTVIFHQALAEKPPLYPKEFLEKIVGNKY